MDAKVLVIDDDAQILNTVKGMLGSMGFHVDVAASALEAENLFQENEYDVAVVDLIMPEVSGLELLEWMRKHVPKVVPVVLSGTSSAQKAVDSVQLGAFDFVAKPIRDIDDFCRHVSRAVEHKRLEESNAKLLEQVQEKNVELENRVGQLEIAHSMLQSQAVALQVDLNRAKRIQHGLLPRETPFSDRVSLAAVYRPAGKVGGDLYDVFALDEHRMGLYMADTSGHGVSSAMLTVFVKCAVQRSPEIHGQSAVLSPSQVLRNLNKTLVSSSFGPDIFVSMTYLVLDADTFEAQYSSAGHRPMYVKRRAGAVERLRHPSPALGINADVTFTDASFRLDSGDMLILFTDGLTDARDPAGDFYGEERLQKAIASGRSHSDLLAEDLDDDLLRFSVGRPYEDDVTLLVLGIEPQRKALRAPEADVVKPVQAPEITPQVTAASHDNRLFITVWGSASWQESQKVLELCNQARRAGERSVVLDFAHCTHLDSTFLGVLHELATEFDRVAGCRLEIQHVPHELLKEMSELGLSVVLLHFRPAPLPLPPSMQPIEATAPIRAQMGRLLLQAHEALVEADPRNADRFADVLRVLHAQAEGTPEQK
ncbi:MAG TPA: SpoIIE family protein phosphatase [Candidatus Hydrogenedentes bacterium]|nr:SpoIIE family protein phosphatase [Candidatus Hydrogenedentota bacterium]